LATLQSEYLAGVEFDTAPNLIKGHSKSSLASVPCDQNIEGCHACHYLMILVASALLVSFGEAMQ